jgi:mannose-1-phosphate guanylyltransferase
VSARTVEAFVEKPDAAIAANYVAERYLWNSGNLLFHAATMLGEIERFEPAMAEAAKATVAGLTRDLDFLRLASEPFARAPRKSIDYAVCSVPSSPPWFPPISVGRTSAWSTVWDVLDHDAAGCRRAGRRAAVEHRRVYRPWGYYQHADIAPRYRVKRIVVKPGSKLSLQKHFHRSEHWVVVESH